MSIKNFLAISTILSLNVCGFCEPMVCPEPLPTLCHYTPSDPCSDPLPWFTGPILTSSGHTIPPGFVDVEPYILTFVNKGIYDRHWHKVKLPTFYAVQIQTPVYIGITNWMDILLNPSVSYNSTEHVSNLEPNDFTVTLDFALLKDTPDNNVPGIKFYLSEVFPIGHYQKRDPDELGTDIGGSGTFTTQAGMVITRTFHIWCEQYLALRFQPFYTVSSPLHIRGFSVYGGDPSTKGRVTVGRTWGGFFGMEYSLTRNWAFACDLYGVYKDKTKFHGKTSSPAGYPQSVQFSLAPAIEYNWSSGLGIIAGSWFTFAGKNSTRFVNGTIALNYFGPIGKQKPSSFTGGGGGGSP